MLRAKYTLYITGSTTVRRFLFRNADDEPINLTGFTGSMVVKPSPKSRTVYANFNSKLSTDGSGLNMEGGGLPITEGSIDLIISFNSASMIPSNSYYYIDFYSGSFTYGFLEGKIVKL